MEIQALAIKNRRKKSESYARQGMPIFQDRIMNACMKNQKRSIAC